MVAAEMIVLMVKAVMAYYGPYPLHEAASSGDLEAVKFFISRKHVDSYDQTGRTALHIAIENGHVTCVQELLLLGADVNIPNKSTGQTACHQASFLGRSDILDILLRYGAAVFEIDRENCDPLHYAAKNDAAVAIETLAKLGVSMECRDKVGATPLHVAAALGKLVSIRQLCSLKADLNSTDQNIETPLHMAVRSSQTSAIAELVQLGANVEARNKDNECPLHVAVRMDLWTSAQQLIKSGASMDTPWQKGVTSLHLAAIYSSCHVISLLVLERCDLNTRDKAGNTALHHAVMREQTEAISKLVELGADVNAKGKRGDTCLHVAVKLKKTKLVQLLVRLGADCNLENEQRLFPVYLAAVNDDVITCRCLKRAGADVNKLNTEGDTVVHILVEEEKFEGFSALADVNVNLNVLNKDGLTAFHISSVERNLTSMRKLKELGANINAPDKHGLTALHLAVMRGGGEETDLLHDLGVDMDAPTLNFSRKKDMHPLGKQEWPPEDIDHGEYWKVKGGLTAVHLAFLHGHDDLLKHVVSCGSDINRANKDGETVFHLAVFYNRLDMMKTLLSLGADRNCKDSRGRTPLLYVAHTGSLDAVRLLLKNGACINDIDSEGRQAIHYAAAEGHFLLLPEFTARSRAVDLNCKDNMGFTPLHRACQGGHVDTIVDLLTLGADDLAVDNDGNTTVHMAACQGQTEVIAQLAALGSRMDAQNLEKKTPLHVAGEAGQGAVMELLLLCGCDPNIRDMNDNLASTFRLSPDQKRSVAKRIKQYNDNHSDRHQTGEITFDSRMVPAGKPIEFEKLGVSVQLTSEKNCRPIIFIHRTPADSAQLDVPVRGLEEILSDVYELRVFALPEECPLRIEVPLDGYPGNFEAFLRTAEAKEYSEVTTSEENGIPTFIGMVPVQQGTVIKFAVLARPRAYSHVIEPNGGVIMSEIDRRIRIEVPKGAVRENVSFNIQVLKTSDLDSSTPGLFAADLVTVTLDQALRSPATVQLPLHVETDEPEELAVFCVPNEGDVANDFLWKVVDSFLYIQNGCVKFTVSHFGMFVVVYLPRGSKMTQEAGKRQARDRIKAAILRETSVLFFCALAPKKDSFLTIFECTTPGRFQSRKEFWEREGFTFHPQLVHSGHFPAKPNETFYFDVKGNVKHVDYSVDVGRRKHLTFNPRSYKYQSFYVTRVQKGQPLIGELTVYKSPTGAGSFLTSVPLEVMENKSCVIS
ncbi:serine/threonine-protein phosphatase 6 regulatory ankyrin repeat subunit B-like [Dreissena polymorpha]|uniref:serine/threonine-protein phosphatase 6 regulatory ankyrin repeat subunit B-like n=1 Tax=Dreissena polymorpha TaxID=45954 RepID=UPI0022645719|nr:serine/threonine-protein phosphatase 6 regulatory ankyrin repeat subunit B-like [Dreissena polymorpha]